MKTALCIFLVAAFGLGAFAADDSAFTNANQAYAEGGFEEAANAYETLIGSGNWNANLFYDLGNARDRLGEFVQAFLKSERALALDTSHTYADGYMGVARVAAV